MQAGLFVFCFRFVFYRLSWRVMAIVCCNERLRCAMICSHVCLTKACTAHFNSGLDLKTIQKAKEKGMGAIRRHVLWLLMALILQMREA